MPTRIAFATLLPILLIACNTALPPPTGSADAGRCQRLIAQYERYSTSSSQQARRGYVDYEIGIARCRRGNYVEGVSHLERAVRQLSFVPVS